MPISDWPQEQRPRERLIKHGASALSNAELLAIFLRTGIPGKNAIDLGRDLIEQFGSLNALFCASLSHFCAQAGMGPAKYTQLQAIMELARRALHEEMKAGSLIDTPQTVKQYLQLALRNKQHESFAVLFLDVQNRLIAYEELFRGTLTHTSVYPREIAKAALANNAAGLILAHNHPSGTATPSKADLHLTKALQQALALIDVRILDHMVIAGNHSYSLAEHGQL